MLVESYSGSLGVMIDGNVNLSAGTVLDIVVGGEGSAGLITDGGGGASDHFLDGGDGQTGQDGQNGFGSYGGAGGTAGSGGGAGSYVDSSFTNISYGFNYGGNGQVIITAVTTVPAPASAEGITILLAGVGGLRFLRRRRAIA